MGEYYKPVNLTKKQFIHPHRMGNGLKLGEWYGYESATVSGMVALMKAGDWSRDDVIVALSDYGSQFPIQPIDAHYDGDVGEAYRALTSADNGEASAYANVSARACELLGIEVDDD